MTAPRVQRGLDAAKSDAELLRIAQLRISAKAVGLPLDASAAEIERAENLRVGRNPTTVCGSSTSDEAAQSHSDDLTIEPEPTPLEKEVQREVRRRFVAAGCVVYWLSQARKSGQTPGLPDLWVFHAGRGVGFWFECKRPGGQLSDAQREFRDLCAKTQTRHVSGGVAEADIAINRWGLKL